jgi:hypothetical protein
MNSYSVRLKQSFTLHQRPAREADHSLPCSAKVKNAWSYTSIPPIRLHGMVLSETQELSFFTFLLHYIITLLYLKLLHTALGSSCIPAHRV